MRIVMIAHSFPRGPGDVPGSFLGRLAAKLVERGHTIVAVTPADQGSARRFVLDGVEVTQVRYAAPTRETLAYTGDMRSAARSLGGAWTFYSLVRAMRRAAAAEAARINADLVHAFWWIPGGWSAIALRRPIVISLMGTDVAMMRGRVGRALARRVLGGAGRVTAISSFLADETRLLLGRPDMSIKLVPVPVDVYRFPAVSGARSGIVYLGRLTEQKRVALLLDAVSVAGITVPVTIVGDGSERGALEQHSRALGLDNVRFLGVVPDAEVPTLVGRAAVTAFLGRREGLGLAAAEAQMLGTPVVATRDGGGVLDLLRDGEGAALVEPTAEAVGQALRRALEDSEAPEAARRAGERLRTELSPAGVAARFEEVYASIA